MSSNTFENKEIARRAGALSRRGPGKDTQRIRDAFHNLLEDNLDNINKDLEVLEPKDRLNFFVKVAEYILPKLQRSETRVDVSALTNDEVERLVDRILQNG